MPGPGRSGATSGRVLDSGVHLPNQVRNDKFRTMAELIGIHPPSDTTCRTVRAFMLRNR